MNLLLVNSAAPGLWGGGEKWFVEAAAWFAQQNITATIAGRPHSKLLAAARKRGVPAAEFSFGGDFDPLAMLRARKLLKQCRAEIVLTNFNKESWQLGVAGLLQGIPVVARHGFTLWSNKAHHRWLAERVLTRVIVNAQSIADHYADFGFKIRAVDVIPNGVSQVSPLPGALRRQLEISSGELLLVAAGRLESQKRFDKLLQYAAELSKTTSFKLAIFGSGPHEQTLRAQAGQLGLNRHVYWCGFDPEFAAKVCDADLFLLTSDSEGAPNVVLEAMAAGVPVLGFEVGNMRALLQGELSSFLVPQGNDVAFIGRLHELCAQREYLADTRKKFRTRAVDEFSFEQSMRRYLEVFRHTVSHG